MKLPLHHLATILDVDTRWQAVESVAHPSAPQVIYASGRFGCGSVRAHDIDGVGHIRLEIILFGIAQLIAQVVVDIIATLANPCLAALGNLGIFLASALCPERVVVLEGLGSHGIIVVEILHEVLQMVLHEVGPHAVILLVEFLASIISQVSQESPATGRP